MSNLKAEIKSSIQDHLRKTNNIAFLKKNKVLR